MLASLKLSIQTLTALTIFNLMLLLPSSFSMNVFSRLTSLDDINESPATLEDILSRHIEKRESGSDPWNICPYGISQVACFDMYLEVYSRMRKMVASSNMRQIIGKRFDPSNEPCPDNKLCLEI
ncbi:uncharacterized protein LOC129928701 [Biomphalaria glabrata]|uniref:Uncharacterized protein LOC129928701 n=1 Tax=Biomphalaria glabrata TaxID=6526 RepID=A0A9W3BL23_BIOGL|nr:uncharacterized protein LOC129928701 [Biomphalaria glabrata]